MRRVCSATLLFYAILAPVLALGQTGGTDLSVTNYRLVGETRSTRTDWFVSYRADLVNTGPARSAVTATVRSLVPSIQIVTGQNLLHFGPVPANSTVSSA